MNELLLRRRVAASTGMPYDSEVTYLRSDGVAYINSGIPFTDNVTVKSKMAFVSKTTAGALFGYRFVDSGTTTGNMRWFFIYNTNNTSGNGRRFGARFGVSSNNSSKRISNDWWTVHDVDFDGTNLKFDGSNWITISQKYETSDYGDMYIFSANCEGHYGDDIKNSEHPIVLFQIYNSGTLVRDYIPVRVGQVGYFYDRVSGQLFGNAAGSGAFLFGNDVTT